MLTTIQGLWRGNLVAEFMWVISASIQFGTFAMYKHTASQLLGLKVTKIGTLRWYFSRKLQPSFLYFVEQQLAQQQRRSRILSIYWELDLPPNLFPLYVSCPPPIIHSLKVYSSISHAVTTIYRTNGIKGFYYGICPSLWQFIPYVCALSAAELIG